MDSTPLRKHIALWALRLMLATLFLFGGEVLVWAELQILTPAEIVLRVIAYVALATLVLDLATRYRIRDVYDGMALMGIYGVLAGLLITPEISFSDFPRTLVTRVLGGHNLTGAIAFGMFLAFTAGPGRRYRWLFIALMAWLGFYRGIWLRWTPEFNTAALQSLSLTTLFAIVGMVILTARLLLFIALRSDKNITPPDFHLPFTPFLLLIVTLLFLFGIRLLQVNLTGTMLLVAGILLFICLAILWFRRADKGAMLLDNHIPPAPLSLLWIALAVLLFCITAIFSYALPLAGTPEYNQLWLMEIGYGAVGFLWLPVLAGVIAIRGVDRQMRTHQADIL